MKRLILLGSLLLLSLQLVQMSEVSAETSARSPVEYNPTAHEPGWIEVKFAEGTAIRLRDGELVDLNRDDTMRQPDVAAVLANVASGTWQRSHSVSEADLDQTRREAAPNARQPLPDLNLYFRLRLPNGMTPAVAIAQFATLDIVQHVTPIDRPTQLPLPPDYEQPNDGNLVNPANPNSRNMYQKYLNPAPDGIDAEYAWTTGDGKGNNVKICDVEYGYFPHADLPSITRVGGAAATGLDGAFYSHGTAVISIMGGRDNGWGVTGIANQADFYYAASRTRFINLPGFVVNGLLNVAAAISECSNALDAGDVIIIEQQTGGPDGFCLGQTPAGCIPAEWKRSNYDAIVTAVAKGIVVIEAAGNGGVDLDDPAYNAGHAPFLPGNDSGAIIVGSSYSAYTNQNLTRLPSSTFGDTVDLFAWGSMDIAAAGYGDLYAAEGSLFSYTQFGGTSGASPIVAASAAIVQSSFHNENGSYASPAMVKQILQSTGTAQALENGENIGMMPNLRAALNQIYNVSDLPAPIISPGTTGSYAMPMEIDIDYGDTPPAGSNNNMRYTLDGSEPTWDSFIIIPEFDETLTLAYGVVIKAKAFRYTPAAGVQQESATATVTYVSTTPKVETPQVSTGAGIFEAPYQVVITSNTPGATIKYRTDGKTIGLLRPGTTYSGPISLQPGTFKISTVAYKDGFYKSDQVKSAEFEVVPITMLPPSIYPAAGQYQGSVSVHLSSTVLGATIRYTLDGTTPTSSSPMFNEPIMLSANATVKARVYLNGFTESPVISQAYTVISQAAAPTISPADGSEANDFINITMSTSTPGATIRYTTNGATPQLHSSQYNGQFTLGIGAHTVKARAFIAGAEASATTTANYTVYDLNSIIDPPTITPAGGIHNGPIMMTLSSDTEDVFLFYTLDGTDPQSSPSVQPYSGPVELVGDATYFVRARAFKSGVGNSNMSSATIVVVNPTLGQVVTPTISPVSGTYNNSISVQVVAPDHQSPFRIRRLFVTRDGTEPIVDFSPSGGGKSNPYSVSLSKPETVQAVSAQSGWFNSEGAMAEYAFQCGTPTITDGGTFTDTVNVEMETITNNATIRYTTDGSEPDVSSALYNSIFHFGLGVGEHVVKAKCFRNDFDPSETVASVFIVNATPVAPVINDQPRNGDQTVNTCDVVTLTTSATGTAPLAYQWFKDGSRVAGEIEPELEISVVQLGDAGTYTATVNNAAGADVTSPATLTVIDNGAQCNSVPTAVALVGGFISAEITPLHALLPLITLSSVFALALRSRRRSN